MKVPIKGILSFQENSRTTDRPKRLIVAAVWMENCKKSDLARYTMMTLYLRRHCPSVDKGVMLDQICLDYNKTFRAVAREEKPGIRKLIVKWVRK